MQVALKDKSVRTRIVTYDKHMHIHIKSVNSDLFTSADGIDVVITHAPFEAMRLFEQVFKLGSLNHWLIAYRVCLKREIYSLPISLTKLAYISLIFKWDQPFNSDKYCFFLPIQKQNFLWIINTRPVRSFKQFFFLSFEYIIENISTWTKVGRSFFLTCINIGWAHQPIFLFII